LPNCILELFSAEICTASTHNAKLFAKYTAFGEIVDRGEQFAFRKVPGCPKNDYYAGIRQASIVCDRAGLESSARRFRFGRGLENGHRSS
jgi:hypothetical protein